MKEILGRINWWWSGLSTQAKIGVCGGAAFGCFLVFELARRAL